MGKPNLASSVDHEDPAELQGIALHPPLKVPPGQRAGGREDRPNVGGAPNVPPQAGSLVALPRLVDEQGVDDTEPLGKGPGVVDISIADKNQLRTVVDEGSPVPEQKSNLLSTKRSAVVAQEDEHGGVLLPEVRQPPLRAMQIGEHERRQGGGQRSSHAPGPTAAGAPVYWAAGASERT